MSEHAKFKNELDFPYDIIYSGSESMKIWDEKYFKLFFAISTAINVEKV